MRTLVCKLNGKSMMPISQCQIYPPNRLVRVSIFLFRTRFSCDPNCPFKQHGRHHLCATGLPLLTSNTMLAVLPPELLYLVLDFLDFYDALSLLSTHDHIRPIVEAYLHTNYAFHDIIYRQLLEFEESRADRDSDKIVSIAHNLLQSICDIVELLPKYDHRTVFSEKLDVLQNLVAHRVLHIPNCEDDYGNLCLQVRQIYLHTPSIRILHDPVSAKA